MSYPVELSFDLIWQLRRIVDRCNSCPFARSGTYWRSRHHSIVGCTRTNRKQVPPRCGGRNCQALSQIEYRLWCSFACSTSLQITVRVSALRNHSRERPTHRAAREAFAKCPTIKSVPPRRSILPARSSSQSTVVRRLSMIDAAHLRKR